MLREIELSCEVEGRRSTKEGSEKEVLVKVELKYILNKVALVDQFCNCAAIVNDVDEVKFFKCL